MGGYGASPRRPHGIRVAPRPVAGRHCPSTRSRRGSCVDRALQWRHPLAASHPRRRAPRLDRRGPGRRRHRAGPDRLAEARAGRPAGRQCPHGRGITADGSGEARSLDDLRSGHGHRSVRFATPEPDAGRHAPRAAAERHATRPRAQRGASESLFQQSGPAKRGLAGLMQGLTRAVAGATELEILQAGPEIIVVHTLLGLRALDARTGAVRWSATLPVIRAGHLADHVRLFPSLGRPDRMYVGFDNRLMAYALADGRALWAKPSIIGGWVHDIVEHPSGIIILPESPPASQETDMSGVGRTGLNVARYEDGTTIAAKPLRMRGTVTNAIITGGSAVLAVDAESRTFVNVLDVATATVRLPKDVKIKGQLAYAELTPAGLLYVSRSDAATNGEVNVIDLTRGEPKYKDAIEGTKSAALLHGVDGRTLYIFTSRDHRLYSVDRQDGTYRALSPEIKLQGNEDPTTLEIRPAGIALIASQNLVVLGRDGQIKQQAYYPAPQLPGLLRALYRINSIRAGLYGAAASSYGDAFAQASRQATDTTAKRITGQLAAAYTQ